MEQSRKRPRGWHFSAEGQREKKLKEDAVGYLYDCLAAVTTSEGADQVSLVTVARPPHKASDEEYDRYGDELLALREKAESNRQHLKHRYKHAWGDWDAFPALDWKLNASYTYLAPGTVK